MRSEGPKKERETFELQVCINDNKAICKVAKENVKTMKIRGIFSKSRIYFPPVSPN